MICVLSHLDVVPEGTGWTHAPYGGEIVDGKMYGRGTIDNKGPAISAIYALNALKETGVKLNRRVRVLFGLNEEKGSACVKHYVENGGEIPVMAFTPDAEFPIINGEKGQLGGTFTRKIEKSERYISFFQSGTVSNVVPEFAKATIILPEAEIEAVLSKKFEKVSVKKVDDTLLFEATGISAHASMPEIGDNAIFRLFNALKEINLDGQSVEFVNFITNNFCPDVNGKALGIYCNDEISGDLTLNIGIMDLVNGELSLNLDIRFPVTIDGVGLTEKLENAMKLGGFSFDRIKHSNGIYMPPENRLIQTLSKVYEQCTGEKAELLCIGGGTYAKAMPNCVAFGPSFLDDEAVMHKPDEYVDIEHLLKVTNIYANAMYELSIVC